MKIILANPRGFCAGVNMAIESLETALALFGAPLYVYHEIVHNRPDRRAVPRPRASCSSTTSPRSRPAARCCTAPTASRRPSASSPPSANLRAIDATCPLVTKVHIEAVKFAKEGYTIVLIGHEGHDEVIGTMGEAPASMVLVEDAADVAALTLPADAKLAYLTQTTLSVDEAQRRHRRPADASTRRSSGRTRTTSATRRRTGRRRCGSSCPRPTWCSCSAARTARTASGWRRSPGPRPARRTSIDRAAELRGRVVPPDRHGAGHRRGQRPGGPRAGRASITCRSGSGRRSRAGRCARSTSASRCRANCGC